LALLDRAYGALTAIEGGDCWIKHDAPGSGLVTGTQNGEW